MTQVQAPNRTLGQLNEDDRYRAFDGLQLTMGDAWDSIQKNLMDESVVVVPSISIERTTASSGTVMQAMEERALFLLLLLRQPRLQMIYVTSQPISEAIIEYYLGLLPGVIPSHARARLTLVAVGDGSSTSLSAKLLARPRLLREIRSLIPNPERCHLIPYNTTPLERDVALSLGIPMYGADPRLVDMGSKTGCRRMFEECGVQYPIGAEDLHSVDDIVAAVQGMRARRPSIKHAIVKINEGVSGSGNASMDLDDLPATRLVGRSNGDRRTAAADSAGGGDPVCRRLSWRGSRRAAASSKSGSPASHWRVRACRCELCPTAPSNCFPPTTSFSAARAARSTWAVCSRRIPGYAATIAEPAMVVGRHLAQRGVLGRFRGGFRYREGRDRRVDAVCDRAEPSQRRNHASVLDAAVPVRRELRRGAWCLRDS